MVYMFLNGGGMRGGPLHDQLQGAPLVAEISSAPRYRFYAVHGDFPAMARAAGGEVGCRVAGEVYDLPLDVLRDSLLPAEPEELELGGQQ
ncbi:MAG: gamma-glutamylcyclotransferase, partial [Actinophytocola sp.]|nr:gamma-glutamylcyclotransferase [Actinophytocola sp.]